MEEIVLMRNKDQILSKDFVGNLFLLTSSNAAWELIRYNVDPELIQFKQLPKYFLIKTNEVFNIFCTERIY